MEDNFKQIFLKISYQLQTLKQKSNKMQIFAYWHAQFDSIFLKPHPKLSTSFINEFSSIYLACSLKESFKLNGRNLTNLLQFLQKVIINADRKHCNCSQLETKKIQSNLDNLLCLIQTEKVYGRQYWLQNQRRVQASIVHHFFYLRILILAIIPQSCRSISEALSSKKLCIQITKIEDLANHYLQNLRLVYDFLQRDRFSEEKLLTKQLLQSINKFWAKLPQLSKPQLSDIPKLMRYICLNNHLDFNLSKLQQKNMLQLRKKSQTIEINGRIAKIEKRSQSCFDTKSDRLVSKYERLDSTGKTQSKQINSKNKKKKLLFFKFKKQVMQRSPKSSKLQKSKNIISHQTIKNVFSRAKYDRLRSTTFIPQKIIHSLQNRASTKDNRENIQNQRFIGQVRDRMITKSVYSDLSLEKKKYKFEKEQEQEQQVQRRTKKRVAKGVADKIKLNNNISNFIQLLTGKVKGWALVRESINQKIVKNKLKQLHMS